MVNPYPVSYTHLVTSLGYQFPLYNTTIRETIVTIYYLIQLYRQAEVCNYDLQTCFFVFLHFSLICLQCNNEQNFNTNLHTGLYACVNFPSETLYHTEKLHHFAKLSREPTL